MTPRALRLVLAAAIALPAVSLPSAAAAAGAGGSANPAAPLIHRFPLGTQTLSRTTTAGAARSATTPRRASATTPRGASATTPTRPSGSHRASGATARRHVTAPAGPSPGAHGVGYVLFLLVLPAVIVVGLLMRAAIRSSRRTVRPGAHPTRRPRRSERLAASGTRWEFEDQDELDGKQQPLPIRSRSE